MTDAVDVTNDADRGEDPPGDWRFNRRKFLIGAAAAAGAAAAIGATADELFLGGLQTADATAPAVPEELIRTGHSNNCDGACGHLVHVADGKVKLVEGAPYDKTTINGQSHKPTRRASACAASRRSRTSTARTASSIHTSASESAGRASGSGSAGTRPAR
jgi:hypothetical protein